ncbi:ABC-F family ATP-binding cassette domain-containing protein [Deinococcus radiodurans]|nr:ABC-F family ATP-binding cassette domain-containing protein [Deinococcus radiodurans]ANC72276.1 ABC transporter [Deinococcus radiodurans R1 = ATCC 13939 = DSM 20539]QIP28655.1 ABC-F family ATP-binding cassette domain-containing protein [Deinococcus radiodurans]QIP32638.1 ABC-F family ATP-binding cassette domain-containing protein [Deinococcus radiodurans]UID69479.1 ABC transporter [Deinococcus radiodurans R1 = ATCC 13939 = DSM 20539]
MLRAREVARRYGDQTIFAGVTLDLAAGERLALIGENGSGKSTLLRVLAGLDAPDAGHVTRTGRVSLLTQHTDLGAGHVLNAVTPPELRGARTAFEQATERLSEGSDAALTAFADAEERYRLAGGYDFGARANGVLAGLHLDAGADAGQLSGGQLRRVMLARLLLSPADLYLLDEPTNHLDADGAAWLEGWILAAAAAGAAFILASHDRAFLDAVATHTAELERGALTVYPGNYSAAMELKATLREAQQRDYAAYKRKRAALEQEKSRLKSAGRSADKFSHQRAGNVPLLTAKNKAQDVANTLAGRARSMERQLERLDAGAVAKPFDDRRVLTLDLPPLPPGPQEVLTVRDLGVTREGQEVLSSVNLHVRRGDRVALTGPNGGGKSTLLRAVLSELPHTGTVTWGAGLTRSVAGQHGEELRGLGTVGGALLDANPALTPHQLHEIAAQVGLPGPLAALATLSGGQRTRLSLARLSVTRAQVLLLDEPTNHLDLPMIEALEALLLAFPGTVLLASHDRRLLERTATRVWAVGGGGVTEQE